MSTLPKKPHSFAVSECVWLGVACPEVMGLAELGGQDRGLVHGTAVQGSPAAGKRQELPGKKPDSESTDRRSTGWPRLGSALQDGARSAPTHMCGQRHPSCKPHLPPRRCKPQGNEEQVASGCSEPAVPHHNPAFSNIEQHDRRCCNPGGSSLRLSVGVSISQPCGDSTLYSGNWQVLSVAPTSAELSTASQALVSGQRPHQHGRARSAGAARGLASACELDTARFKASPSCQPCGTEPGSSSSGSAAWLDLARLWQKEEASKAVVWPAGHWDSSRPLQPHRAQPILTVGQRGGRIWPLIRAIAKLTGLEWVSLKGPP